jgi:hypothetical protein
MLTVSDAESANPNEVAILQQSIKSARQGLLATYDEVEQ